MVWKPRKYIRWVGVVVSIGAIVAVIAWVAGAFHAKIPPVEEAYEAPTAGGRALVKVETLSIEQIREAVGTVRPRLETDVASQILATILTITVNPGDRVEAGQLLATLDDREIQTQLNAAQAALAAAKTELGVRQREYERYQKLMASEAGTEQEFEQVTGAYQEAQSQVRRAEEQVNRMEVNLSYTRMTAQKAGIVVERYADPGDLAAPGKAILSLHDPKVLELHADVAEGLADKLKPGMKLDVEIDAVSLKTQGTVREIVPQAQVSSRAFLVKVTLPVEDIRDLYVGMFGRLAIPVGQTEHLVLPADAVQHVGQLALVDVVNASGKLERRFVRTGQHYDGTVEILTGVRAGETVAKPLVPESPPPGEEPVAGPLRPMRRPSVFRRSPSFAAEA